MTSSLWSNISLNTLRTFKTPRYVQKRFKKKRINEKTNVDRAMDYFEKVYPPIYDRRWKAIKKALFLEPKYAALVNNFSDNEDILKTFEELGAFNVGSFYTEKVEEFIHSNEMETSSFSDEERKHSTTEKATIVRESSDIGLLDTPKEHNEAPNSPNADQNFSRLIKTPGKNHASVVYSYMPSTMLKGLENWFEEIDVLSNAQESEREIGVNKKVEIKPLVWPRNLNLFAFVTGESLEFPSPLPSKTLGAYTHYLLNGSSILPVLALDLQKGDAVLDMCSSPGGKSLAILQTFLPESLVCNDVSLSRLKRVESIIEQYVPAGFSSIRNIIFLSQNPGSIVNNPETYDKVLVDAPCLNDRHSLSESDNSIFKPGRIHERLRLPELQADLILSALKSTKRGGCVVYSTCTLSPLQNDGAVHLALTRAWKETKMECTVVNMAPTLSILGFMFKFGHGLGLRYGHIVLPVLDNNYGPMYICKLIKN